MVAPSGTGGANNGAAARGGAASDKRAWQRPGTASTAADNSKAAVTAMRAQLISSSGRARAVASSAGGARPRTASTTVSVRYARAESFVREYLESAAQFKPHGVPAAAAAAASQKPDMRTYVPPWDRPNTTEQEEEEQRAGRRLKPMPGPLAGTTVLTLVPREEGRAEEPAQSRGEGDRSGGAGAGAAEVLVLGVGQGTAGEGDAGEEGGGGVAAAGANANANANANALDEDEVAYANLGPSVSARGERPEEDGFVEMYVAKGGVAGGPGPGAGGTDAGVDAGADAVTDVDAGAEAGADAGADADALLEFVVGQLESEPCTEEDQGDASMPAQPAEEYFAEETDVPGSGAEAEATGEL
eukprot:g2706.t1